MQGGNAGSKEGKGECVRDRDRETEKHGKKMKQTGSKQGLGRTMTQWRPRPRAPGWPVGGPHRDPESVAANSWELSHHVWRVRSDSFSGDYFHNLLKQTWML